MSVKSLKRSLSLILVAVLLVTFSAVALAEEVELDAANASAIAEIEDQVFRSGEGTGPELVNTHVEGFYAEWKDVPASTQVKLSYDTDASNEDGSPLTMSLYVNGKFAVKLPIPSTKSWWGSFPVGDPVDVVIPEGATIRIQKDAGDSNANIRKVILVKGTPAASEGSSEGTSEENPKTGDAGALVYIAMAAVAGGALVSRKRFAKK